MRSLAGRLINLKNVVIINAPCFLLGFQLADHQNLLNLMLLPLEELVGQLVLRKALQQ